MTTLTIAASALPARTKHRFLIKPHPLAVALTAAACALLTALPAQATDLLHAWQAAQSHDPQWLAAQAAHGRQRPAPAPAGQGAVAAQPGAPAPGAVMAKRRCKGRTFRARHGHQQWGGLWHFGHPRQRHLQRCRPASPCTTPNAAPSSNWNASADIGDLQWQAARQAAMLRTAQQYLDLAVAQEALRVLEQQLAAINRTLAEAQERFDLGAAPITAVHEARAQQAQLQARSTWPRKPGRAAPPAARHHRPASGRPGPAPARYHRPPGSSAGVVARTCGRAQLQHPPAATRRGGRPSRSQQAPRAPAPRPSSTWSPRRSSSAYRAGRLWPPRPQHTQALVGVQLTVPLYTGGYRSAKADETQAQAQAAQAQLAATQTLVAQQVHAAWLGEQTGVQQGALPWKRALQASAARQEATRMAKPPASAPLDVLHADNDHAATTLALAQARSRLRRWRNCNWPNWPATLDEAALQQANQAFAQAPKP